MKARILAILSLLMICFGIRGEEARPLRPVLSAFTVEGGTAHVIETYLSPLRYSGQRFGVGYERMQAMKFDPSRWTMDLEVRLMCSHTLNPAHNATMWHGSVEGRWSMMRTWRRGPWRYYAGGNTDLDLGVMYNARNSNNPVAAKAAWTVGVTGAVAFNTKLRGVPVCLRYMATLPLTGAFFSPAYGELYYEIYLGNRHGLCRAAWPGNYFRLDNLLSADLRFGGTVLRLGYRLDVRSSEASHIVTRTVTHTAVVGVASEWISLSAKRPLPDADRIINALY